MDKRFNIRVYGILRNEQNEILVSDERQSGISFTKFPGGGLEWGEGMRDCLKRELKEELGIRAEIEELFFATDFFQQSAFRSDDQLLSFYYRVYAWEGEIETAQNPVSLENNGENFRWIALDEISAEIMTFPIDKIVATKLSESFGN